MKNPERIENKNPASPPPGKRGLKWLAVFSVAVLAASLIGIWAVQRYLLPEAFAPVRLTDSEKKVLDGKIARMERIADHPSGTGPADADDFDAPEPYVEDPARRTIVFSEKEVNALIAGNTDLAKELVIDLSDGMASARLLVRLDDTLPLFGGKTLKVAAGLGIDYSNGQPVVMLKGISIWGVPVPNAWLGNMKNVDLVKEFGAEKGFWKSFADGIDKIEIREKSLQIRLRE